MSLITFSNVDKSYGTVKVIDRLNLDIEEGEFLSLLGPSGSGKTTSLMMLAGFEAVSSGQITMDGLRIDDVATYKRGMGIVFQNYALFPHMSVAENIAFPLRMRKVARAEIATRVAQALDRVRLGHLGDRRPAQLSGGQQQRVALARALVFEPRVILLDEPLGALDKNLREEMQLELRSLHHNLGLTFVFVTHDQGEALTMSDRIAVFDRGRIAQIGSPAQIYDAPDNLFVAGFVGETNFLSGTALAHQDGAPVIQLETGDTLRPGAIIGALSPGAEVRVSLRPEAIRIAETGCDTHWQAQVSDVVYQGGHTRVILSLGNASVVALLPQSQTGVRNGDRVSLGFDTHNLRAFCA
ncbi:ABC transporter ATP-binding protein [Arenibacterium sp. LLYu02]|uniref:ABC transporter ATP-binding protein n=1 Tax=Arenibacterium sp. LLYu02 TaxID=3404132 RepID=UPI003B210979